MPTAADLQSRFPEAFAATSPAVLEAALAEAESQESAAFWGSDYETAVLYKAAHLAVAGRTGGAAGVASAQAGPTSITFAQGGDHGGAFLQMYRNLQRRRTAGVAISGCMPPKGVCG